MNMPSKWIAAGVLAVAGVLAAGPAEARDHVSWSIGLNLPINPYGASIGTTIGNGPVYAPVYVQPAPVYYAPAPVYYAPAPVYYAPAPAYYAPPPAYYRPHQHRRVVMPAPVYMAPRHAGYYGY